MITRIEMIHGKLHAIGAVARNLEIIRMSSKVSDNVKPSAVAKELFVQSRDALDDIEQKLTELLAGLTDPIMSHLSNDVMEAINNASGK